MLVSKSQLCDLPNPLEPRLTSICTQQQQTPSILELAEAAGNLVLLPSASEGQDVKVSLAISISAAFLPSDELRARLQYLQKTTMEAFPSTVSFDWAFSIQTGPSKVRLSLKDFFFEECVEITADCWVVAKQAIISFGAELAATIHGVDSQTLLAFFHESEVSFAGLMALESASNATKVGVKRLFKLLKKYSFRLEAWKSLLCGSESLGLIERSPFGDISPIEGYYSRHLEEEKDDPRLTAENTMQAIDLERQAPTQYMDSKDWLAYVPCDSMPALRDDNQSSADSSRSIQSRCGSFYPGKGAKVSGFAARAKPSRLSTLCNKEILKATEQELEAALEDSSLDSSDDDFELGQLLEDVQWFFSKKLEELLASNEYYQLDLGYDVACLLRNQLQAHSQKLLVLLSRGLMGDSFQSLLQQDFRDLLQVLPQPALTSPEALTSQYLAAVLEAARGQSHLSSAAALSIDKKVRSDYSSKVKFAEALADFCENRLLSEFLEKLAIFSQN